MKYLILGILSLIVAAVAFKLRNRQTRPVSDKHNPKSEKLVDRKNKATRSELVSRKTGLPHHEMLEHFEKGIRITPAQKNELPSLESISNFEKQIGWEFPSQYKEFQLKYGAFFSQVDESIWPTATTGGVMPFWATNYGYIIYGFAENCPPEFDIQRKYYQFKDTFPDLPFFMPIHREVAGDGTYVGFDEAGNLVTADQYENQLEPVNMDFDSFVSFEAAELLKRMKKRIEYNETGKWPYLN